MKTLNLVYFEKSDIKYRIDRFPDGQQQVVIDADWTGGRHRTLWGESYKSPNNKTAFTFRDTYADVIQIKSRLNNFKDLELIICATKSLRNLGVKEIHLYTPYFLGSRSDRQFEAGSDNYLKDVICPIINSLNFESVTVLDPHSDVLEACLNNFKKQDNRQLVHWALATRYSNEMLKPKIDLKDFILVSPDAGASKKIYKLSEQIGYKGDIITCSKDRDVDGKLTKTVVPITDEHHNMLHKGPYKDFIIIDDICDGGATFINIAKEIKSYFHENGNTKSKIYLIVTHGIFSKGFEELSQYFDGIYCTNSYKDITFPWSLQGYLHRNSQQLNVF